MPQPLHKDIVDPAALAVHADDHTGLLEDVRESLARELASLISVEDLRGYVLGPGFFECLDTEGAIQRIR